MTLANARSFFARNTFGINSHNLKHVRGSKKNYQNLAKSISSGHLSQPSSGDFARATPVTRSVSRTLRKHRFSACMSYWYLFHLTGFFFPCPRHIRHSRLPRTKSAHMVESKVPIAQFRSEGPTLPNVVFVGLGKCRCGKAAFFWKRAKAAKRVHVWARPIVSHTIRF